MALAGAFSVIVKTDGSFEALEWTFLLVSEQIKCLMFVWSQVQECVLCIFDTCLSPLHTSTLFCVDVNNYRS